MSINNVIGMSGGQAVNSNIVGIGNIYVNDKAKRIQDRTLRQIATLTKGKAKTKGLESVLRKISSGTTWVTISGPAGEGKTTTAYMVLGELSNIGRRVYKVTTPDEFADVACDFNPVIMVDDIFGSIEFEYLCWNNWYSVISDVLSVEEDQEDVLDHESSNKPTVIFVGRDNVIHSSLRHMDRWSTFFTASQFVVSIGGDRDVQEKVDIWNILVMRSGANIEQSRIQQVCQLTCPHGFPHMCKLFLTMFKEDDSIPVEEFFRTPLKFLNQTMKKLMLDDLKLCLFKEMIKGDGLVYFRTLSKLDKSENILRAAYDLVGSYLYEEEDCFMFDHASIYDSVASLLCVEDPVFVIEHCSLSFIHQRLRLNVSNKSFLQEASAKSTQKVFVAFAYAPDLAKRFAEEIGLGHLYLVLSHTACKILQFVETFVEYLTRSNIDLFSLRDDTWGYSFLFLTPSSKSVHMLAKLLKQKAELDTHQTVEVLFGACWFVAVDVLNYLTEHFEIDIDSRGDIKPLRGESLSYCTPIMIAAQSKDEQFVQQIMLLNPNVSAADSNGKTVLHYLCENGLTSVVKDIIDKIDVLDCRDIQGRSPLWYSCINEHLDLVRLLVVKGAAFDNDLLCVICKHSNLDIVNLFLEDDLVATENTVQSAFHSACEGGNISIIQRLWELGVSVNDKNKDGFTPLHSACKGNHVDVVKFLCKREADVNVAAKNGHTPLHVAREHSCVGVERYLLEKGAHLFGSGVGDVAKPPSVPPFQASSVCEAADLRVEDRFEGKEQGFPQHFRKPSNSGAFNKLVHDTAESTADTIGMSGGHVQRSNIVGKGNTIENVRARRIKDRTLRQIATLTKGKAKTKGLESVLRKISSGTTWVTISGPAGEGKTTTAYMVLGELLNIGRPVYKVTTPDEFADVACDFNPVIMVDDIFGDIEFEYLRWNNWYSVISDVLSVDQEDVLDHESSNRPTVIFVGRDNVIHSSLRHMDRWSTFFTASQFVVSIGGDRDVQEKVDIWKAVMTKGGPKLDNDEIYRICQIKCSHGFPHVCKLFTSIFKEENNVSVDEFFRAPLKFLHQTMKKLMLDDLKLCLFKEMIKGDGIVDITTLSKLDKSENILRAAYDLVGSYLYEEEDCFMFDHASIYDSVASLLSGENPLFVIEHCSLSFIHQRLRLNVSNKSFLQEASAKSTQKVFVAFAYAPDLAKRFADEIDLGHLYLVLSHTACKILQFVETFMEYLARSNIDLFSLRDDTWGYSFLFLTPSSKSVHMLAKLLKQKEELDTHQTVEVLFGACWFVAVDVLNYLTKHFEIDIDSRGDIKPLRGESLSYCTPIMIAAQSKDEQFVQQIMLLNPNVNAADIYGKTVLHYLCENGLTSVVKDIIDKIDVLDCRDIMGGTPLLYSCKNNQLDIARLLMNKGAKLDAQIFRLTCKDSNLDTVRLFLENGAAQEFLKEDHFGNSAFHSACQGGDMAVVKCLSKLGFSSHDKNKDGFTPLHSACIGNHINVVKFLCDSQADVNAAAENGYTPLHVACMYSNAEIITHLLVKGASVHAFGGRYGAKRTCPIHEACFWHLPENLKCLLKHGANVNSRDGEGQTPLHLAVGNSADQDKEYPLFRQDSLTCETVDVLLEAGADVNSKDHVHKTPLHYIHPSNLKVLRKLIEAGADINSKSKDGSTPLLEISRKSFTLNDPSPMIQLMVEQGTDVKADDSSGQNCLHKVLRIFSHNFTMQRWSYMFLIDHGADLNKQDVQGNTPLHTLCRVEEDSDVITPDGNLTEAEMYTNQLKMMLEELIREGAGVDILNEKGVPALHGWCSTLVNSDVI
ncbi:uncharacterized protein LOC124263564 [Haliotis rubra]|uniref:uncharacterized protein LOC124263564 n=1 Tax=Haliotis rubra TaxID=36100 RepID=UPI001EE5A243|nr:uncharacterized protein LOC124263564 [Haliotis rubra]